MPGRLTDDEVRRWARGALLAAHQAQSEGATSLQGIADALNAKAISSLHGCVWSSTQVWRLLRQHPHDTEPSPRR